MEMLHFWFASQIRTQNELRYLGMLSYARVLSPQVQITYVCIYVLFSYRVLTFTRKIYTFFFKALYWPKKN